MLYDSPVHALGTSVRVHLPIKLGFTVFFLLGVAGFVREKFEVASRCFTSHCSDASVELVFHLAIVGSALCWVLPCLDDVAMFYLGDLLKKAV